MFRALSFLSVTLLLATGCNGGPAVQATRAPESRYIRDLRILNSSKDEAEKDRADAELKAAGGDAVPDLVRCLNDPATFGNLRDSASNYLGWSGTREAAEALIRLADSKDRDTKVLGFSALTLIPLRKVSPAVEDMVRKRAERALETNESRSVLTEAALILGRFHDKRSWPVVNAARSRINNSRALTETLDAAAQGIMTGRFDDPFKFQLRVAKEVDRLQQRK